MNIDEKIDRFINLSLEDIQQKSAYYEELAFFLGNCYLRRTNYSLALKYYRMSINSCFRNRSLWKGSSEPNLLVDILILSKQLDLLDKVVIELETFKTKPLAGGSTIACYAYCITDFLKENNHTDFWIQKILEKPSIKYTYFLGLSLQAINAYHEIEFNQALEGLLKIHNGQAKHGALRETAEGLICMPAMSLIYLAMKNGIAITTESEYIAPEYFRAEHVKNNCIFPQRIKMNLTRHS
jgi:hypothetical protein